MHCAALKEQRGYKEGTTNYAFADIGTSRRYIGQPRIVDVTGRPTRLGKQ